MSVVGTAKCGDMLYKYESDPITPPSSVTAEMCISAGLIISGAHWNTQNGGTGKIEQIDVIEICAGGEVLSTALFKLFITDKAGQTYAAAGSAFTAASTVTDMTNCGAMLLVNGQWQACGAKMQIQSTVINSGKFKTLNSAALYGQLIAKGTYTFAAGSRLMLRIWFRQD